MKELLLFIFSFIVIFFVYLLFIVIPMIRYKNNIKKGKLIKLKKEPAEIKYLINKYGLDLNKVNYNRLLFVVSFVSSLDMAIIVSIVFLFKSYFVQIIIGFILSIILLIFSFSLLGNYYKKKGMCKNV